ncbi:MAG: hypothetical protein LBJ00_08930 [Planctomycetaceae bacterium]|nr:hypothetical protein [Planctomycetaceae bacterium]
MKRLLKGEAYRPTGYGINTRHLSLLGFGKIIFGRYLRYPNALGREV